MACPVCGKAVDPASRHFCSRRCADLDLARWLTGRYVIPTDEGPEDGADGGSTPPRPS